MITSVRFGRAIDVNGKVRVKWEVGKDYPLSEITRDGPCLVFRFHWGSGLDDKIVTVWPPEGTATEEREEIALPAASTGAASPDGAPSQAEAAGGTVGERDHGAIAASYPSVEVETTNGPTPSASDECPPPARPIPKSRRVQR